MGFKSNLKAWRDLGKRFLALWIVMTSIIQMRWGAQNSLYHFPTSNMPISILGGQLGLYMEAAFLKRDLSQPSRVHPPSCINEGSLCQVVLRLTTIKKATVL